MVLTEKQKEIQRKRKISKEASEPQRLAGVSKRSAIDRLDLKQAEAKREGLPTPELVGDKIVEPQVETAKLEQQAEFREEDVTKIQTEVGAEQELLPESTIQESERVRVERGDQAKKDFVERAVRFGATKEEAEESFEVQFNPEMGAILKQTTGNKIFGRVRSLFGDVGKDFAGISLNQFLETTSGDVTKLSALTGQMSEAASMLPAIEGAVNNGAINPYRALAELNSAEKDGEILRGDIDRLAVLRPEIVQTKEYLEMRVELDVYLSDIRDARGTALEKLRTTETEFNILETQAFIDDIEKRNKEKKK